MTALDFETTGSVPGFPVEPWQIGMVQIKNGKVDPTTARERFLRIDPTRPFHPQAPGRHAQIRDQLAASPSLHESWPELSPMLVRHPLIAHNIGTERTILNRYAPLHHFGPWIDTLAWTRYAYPSLPSKALEKVTEALGLNAFIQSLCPRAPHDALYDAFACAVLLQYLLSLPGWEDLPVSALQSKPKTGG